MEPASFERVARRREAGVWTCVVELDFWGDNEGNWEDVGVEDDGDG